MGLHKNPVGGSLSVYVYSILVTNGFTKVFRGHTKRPPPPVSIYGRKHLKKLLFVQIWRKAVIGNLICLSDNFWSFLSFLSVSNSIYLLSIFLSIIFGLFLFPHLPLIFKFLSRKLRKRLLQTNVKRFFFSFPFWFFSDDPFSALMAFLIGLFDLERNQIEASIFFVLLCFFRKSI